MSLPRRRFLAASAAASMPAWPATPRRLRIPHVSARADPEHNYPAQLLKLALAAAGMTVELEPTLDLIPQNRAIQELGHHSGRIDVLWTVTTAEREQQALPVRVPIFRGLYGWRLLLATPERAAQMRGVRSLDELSRFSLVQGLEWPDTDVLQANGLSVVVSASYEAMFRQLRLGRVDAFPRSVEEVWWELERYGQGLTVVPDICLHYPAAVYYFVAPDDHELAAAIELGLHRLRTSGAFERLFLHHHGHDLARAGLGARRVIELSNPLLPPQTPLNRAELWYRP
jgi:hypothetical protein